MPEEVVPIPSGSIRTLTPNSLLRVIHPERSSTEFVCLDRADLRPISPDHRRSSLSRRPACREAIPLIHQLPAMAGSDPCSIADPAVVHEYWCGPSELIVRTCGRRPLSTCVYAGQRRLGAALRSAGCANVPDRCRQRCHQRTRPLRLPGVTDTVALAGATRCRGCADRGGS
jgi:hypothetical protein